MKSKISQLKTSFKSAKIDAFLVTNDTNIRYLTGHQASDSFLLVTSKVTYYITDSRYTLEVQSALKDVEIIDHKGKLYESVVELLAVAKAKKIGYDANHFTLRAFRQFEFKCPKNIKLVESNGLVEKNRLIKTKDEIDEIKRALNLHKKCLQYLKRTVKPGQTECEILIRLEQYVRKLGAGFSFDPIIASGPNSAYPHAKVTRRRIRKNDGLLLDFGIEVNGYKSDLTRMFYFGKIPNLFREVHAYVAKAQKKAIDFIKPGVKVSELDNQARKYLAEHNLDKYFGHALGHGVGLDIHESPRLSQASPEVLQAGMVITIEPGVYLPGQFGVRLEEMVLVTEKGSQVLSDNIN